MRSGLALSKLLLKDLASRYTQQLNVKSKLLGRLVLVLPLLLLLPVVQLAQMLHQSFAAFGKPELSVTYMLVAVVPLLFITAVPMMISLFFFSKDLGLLATLPITTRVVILAKSSVVYVYLLVMGLFILLPSLVLYSVVDVFRPFALVSGLLATLLVPVFPMVLAALLLMPMMKLIGKTSRRGLWLMLGNVALLAIIVGIQVLTVRLQVQAQNQTQDALALIMSENGLLNLIGQRFWPSVWFTQLMTGNLGAGALYFGVTLAAAYAGLVLVQWLYQGAMVTYNEVSANGDAKNTQRYAVSTQSVYWRLIWRHIGIVMNNPTFALQIGLSMFVPILVGGITLLTGEFNLEMLRSPQMLPMMPYIFAGLMLSPVLMGTLSATVITREGKAFWQTLVLPISHHVNLQTRILSGDVMCFVGALVLGVLGAVLLPLKPLEILAAIAFTAAATHFLNAIDLYINVQRPFLNWTHPTAAVKNNLNIMLALLLRLVLGVVFYYGMALLPTDNFQVKAYLGTAVLVTLFMLQQLLFYPKLIKAFKEMEW